MPITADIEVLHGLEPVRRRPTQFIGPLDDPLLPNKLLAEALCCARDDALAGKCRSVAISLRSQGRAVVRDDGPGLPLEIAQDGKRLAEHYLTKLMACACAKSTPEVAASTCKFGLAVLNALCERFHVRVFAAGDEWSQRYERGVAVSAFERTGPSDEQGTELAFDLDSTLLPPREYDTAAFVQWVRANVTALEVTVVDERTGERVSLST